jgi:acetyl esterase/lipase
VLFLRRWLIPARLAASWPHLNAAPEKHGLAFISADYRLAPQVRLPQIMEDIKSAMDFLRSPEFAEATENRIDASKLVVSGGSAGGWLALLAGTGVGFKACGIEPPAAPSVIAAIYPITDLLDPFWNTRQVCLGL